MSREYEARSRGRIHGDASCRYALAYGSAETPKQEARRRALDLYPADRVTLDAYLQGFEQGWLDATRELGLTAGHGNAITNLRLAAEGERNSPCPDEHYHHRLDAVATLLEVHDATGINLGTFGAVGDFVNDVLSDFGYAPFTDNGV